jgi:membrane protein
VTRTEIIATLKQTWSSFQRHNDQWLAAALAYFATFALAPLIIVFVHFAGLFFHNHQAAQSEVTAYLGRHAAAGAGAVRQILAATAQERREGPLAQGVSWVVVVIAAVGLFSALQFALNTIWDSPPGQLTLVQTAWRRVTGFFVMLAVALLLVVSAAVNGALTVAGDYLASAFPGAEVFVKTADFSASFFVLWAAFFILFEYLPDCKIPWRDAAFGAAVTSVLYVAGQFVLGWYLGSAGVGRSYGALGSLVVLLIWINYSAQIVLLGAELTRTNARRREAAREDASPTAGVRYSPEPAPRR